ncbi:hypothetical protein ACFL9T_15625 [Thermodesulfobacteriota bacterium]
MAEGNKTKRVQVVLRPAESKKLIAKAILELDAVKQALKGGILAIHPSSTTYFIREMLSGDKPEGVWLVGMIAPRGTCIEGICHRAFEEDNYDDLSNPDNFPFTWIYKRGKLQEALKLGDLLSEMGEGDVYIKGVNAIDTYGHVGVLLASLAGGTIGRAFKAQKKRQFQMVYVAGQEKLIAGPIKEVAKETGRAITSDALGIPCGLWAIEAEAFTEIEAFRILAGVEAVSIAAGGVGGAEGSIMLVLKGEESNVNLAMNLAKEVKGAKLPDVLVPECQACHSPGCLFAGQTISW